ncbi:MAG: GGDEF domain-containing protein, partial [Burkholderiales bacterium]
IDIDNFKRVNDTLGHAAGDEALRLLARAAAAHTRAADVIARLGGDEFVLLLPETTAQQALPIADRIMASVAATPIGDAADALAVTLSIGIAELRRKPMDDRVEQVVQRADRALYQAKADGRNRTRVFDSGTEDASALGKGRADRRYGRTGAQADGRARGTAGSGRRKRTERGKS